jgi:type III secretion protein V
LAFTGFALRKAEQKADEFAAAGVTTLIGKDDDKAQLTGGGNGGESSNPMLEDMKPPAPVLLELPVQAKNLFSLDGLNQRFTQLRRDFYLDLGVPLSGISMRLLNNLDSDAYRISIRGVPVAQGKLPNKAEGAAPPIDQASFTGNSSGSEIATVNRGLGREMPDGLQVISNHLAYLLRKHAGEFIGIQELHSLYAKLEQAGYVELVREGTKAVNTTKTVDVIRRLLAEGISIRDLRQVLETLIEFGEIEKDTSMLAERVRNSLKRQISYSFTHGTGILPVYMFAPETEKLLQNNLRQTPAGVFFALPPDVTQNFANILRNLEEEHQNDEVRPVILTGMDLRRHVRRHIESAFSGLPVLAVQELTSNISLNPVGEIRLT